MDILSLFTVRKVRFMADCCVKTMILTVYFPQRRIMSQSSCPPLVVSFRWTVTRPGGSSRTELSHGGRTSSLTLDTINLDTGWTMSTTAAILPLTSLPLGRQSGGP